MKSMRTWRGNGRSCIGRTETGLFAGHGRMYREEAKIAALERKIGQLTMENKFFKKLIALNRNLKKTKGSNGQ
jgi:hypothetical protein